MAIGFLTILPVPQKKEWSNRDFGWSAAFYPLAGALIGAAAGSVWSLLSGLMEKPIAAFVTLIIWILLSGGLHWDGLADCMDGFGCSAPPKRRLEIMKDPKLGTYGALGIFCALILKWLGLWFLPDKNPIIFLAMIGAFARWGMLPLIFMPLANPDGMAAMLRKNCPKWIICFAAPVPVILAAIFGKSAVLYLLINFCTSGLLGLTAKRKIGGINGDVLGFCIELSEIVLLLAAQVLP